jgi:hypothetical protein
MIARALLAAALAAAALTVPAPPVEAGTPRCATHPEARQLQRGMTVRQVQRLLGPKGKVVWTIRGGRGQVRTYRVCPQYVASPTSWVAVSFVNGRLREANARFVRKPVRGVLL